MPAKSAKQLRAMYAAAAGHGKLDIPPSVAKEFIKETPKKKKHEMMRHITKSGRVIPNGGM